MNKRVIIIIAAIILLVAAFLFFTIYGNAKKSEKATLITLAKNYIEHHDYDRALDILEKLIVKYPNDTEIQSLLDIAMSKKTGGNTNQIAGSGPSSSNALGDGGGGGGAGGGGGLAATGGSSYSAGGAASPSSAANPSGQNQAGKGTAAPQIASQAATKADAQAKAKAEAIARQAEEEARKKAEAEAQAAQKKAAEAELASKSKALREKMEAVNALVKKGHDAIAKSDYSAARAAFDAAVNSLPPGEEKFASQTYANIAEAYYEGYKNSPQSSDGLDSVKRAQSNAQESIRANQNFAIPHYTLSKIYSDFDKNDLAISELEQAVKLDPQNYLYTYELGKAYFRAKQYAQARQAFETVTEKLNPKYEPAFFNLGMTQKVLGNKSAAIAAFNNAIKLKPDYTRAHIELARLFLDSDVNASIKSYQRALSFDSSNIIAVRELGVAYATANKNAEAEQSFEKAMSLSPDAATAYNLAKVQYDLGKYPKAFANATKAVELSPSVALYHYQLGLCAEKNQNIDLALSSYARSIELDKQSVDARINLGSLYLESGFTDKAISILEEAYKISPRSVEANNNLANAYGAKSMFEKSVFHYETALSLAPKDTTTRLNLSRAYVKSGSLQKALDSYKQLLKLEPSNWDAMYELGKAYISASDSASAKKTLTELLSKKPDFKDRAEVERILAGL